MARWEPPPPKNVLITGSSGQIGTNLALALMERGDTVLGVDTRENTWTKKINTVRCMVGSPLALEAAEQCPPQVVVHLAAHAKVHKSVSNPQLAMDNINATYAALELAKQFDAKFVFASSREVYGNVTTTPV